MLGANSFGRNITGPTKKFDGSQGTLQKEFHETGAKRAAQLAGDGKTVTPRLRNLCADS
jgi:hypothetical protein